MPEWGKKTKKNKNRKSREAIHDTKSNLQNKISIKIERILKNMKKIRQIQSRKRAKEKTRDVKIRAL